MGGGAEAREALAYRSFHTGLAGRDCWRPGIAFERDVYLPTLLLCSQPKVACATIGNRVA